MNARMRPSISIIAVLVLMTVGVIIAAVQGSPAGIALAVMIGTLVLSYAIRHDVRSTYVYHRRD